MKYLLAQLCNTLLDTYKLISGACLSHASRKHPSLGASFIGLVLNLWSQGSQAALKQHGLQGCILSLRGQRPIVPFTSVWFERLHIYQKTENQD